ncbi:unnamed protein product [Rotaria sp. Silwood1]|nr:unnamed protein product [Rotaria sp. Silwood1]CAF0737636.1 unnamed protein product [Rotaria sp. Silwood1]CAF3344972.1 unnamed protein product [Rotaria sp. Silwood1]CAF4549310.1 unnamed protein product [Rotaria sp. Silwood1]CAF4602165.1 unnamed protein product [Rotaria sp. Silwood1]
MTDVLSTQTQWPRSTMPGLSQQQRQQNYQKNTRRTLPKFKNDISPRTTPRKITLFRNGDRYFAGKQYAIRPQNYSNLGQLLQELSTAIDLPYGVRRLFTPNKGSEITDVNIIKDGASYVCASFEPFQKLEYTSIALPRVTFNIEQLRQPLHDFHPPQRLQVRHLPTIPISKFGAVNGPTINSNATTANRFQANTLFLQSFAATTNSTNQQQKKLIPKQNKYGFDSINNKPRQITIVKQGNEKPHKTITILLNRRTVQTYEQLLSDISESFGYQKNRPDKIKRLFNLKGKQVNGINDFFREDDIFVASTNIADIAPTDLQEINIEMLNDTQHSTSRNTVFGRNQLKQTLQIPSDGDTSNAQTGPLTVDLKKMLNVRDSGFLDDEDGLSGRESVLTTSRKTPSRPTNNINNNNNKQYEVASEDAPTPNDLIGRKLKKSTFKPNTTLTIEQQRERERQRLREEDERRKKLLIRKDYQQTATIQPVPKFEPLAVDMNNDETRTNKSKTPTTGTGTFSPNFPLTAGTTSKALNKPLSITPLPRANMPINHDENDPTIHNETTTGAAASTSLPVPVVKKFIIKKRSTLLHNSSSVVIDKYELGKKMGDGNFAVVHRSKLRGTDREYAIKIIDKSKMKGKEYMLDHEINIMYMCNHPNLIRLFEDYETPDEIYLVMELIKGGDLFDYITKHRRFDEPTSSLMIKDVAEALLYLHAKKIVHRDLKPENLLVMQRKDGRITIKLTDFGLAMQVSGPIKTVCGTPTYVAPEILAETGYSFEVDCWATGIILYILLCGYPPFKTADRNQEVLFQLIQRGKFVYDPEYWSSISANAKNLIDHLLVVDRHKRMRADEILLHPWILSVGQSKSMRNTEEIKTALRLKYDTKIKEYAAENNGP